MEPNTRTVYSLGGPEEGADDDQVSPPGPGREGEVEGGDAGGAHGVRLWLCLRQCRPVRGQVQRPDLRVRVLQPGLGGGEGELQGPGGSPLGREVLCLQEQQQGESLQITNDNGDPPLIP